VLFLFEESVVDLSLARCAASTELFIGLKCSLIPENCIPFRLNNKQTEISIAKKDKEKDGFSCVISSQFKGAVYSQYSSKKEIK